MGFNSVGKSFERADAFGKVTGKAKYTGDIRVDNMLCGKVLRSTIAHGYVKKIDISKAKALPGVEAVLTADDVSPNAYPTAGHPYSLDPSHQDIANKNILTKKVRLYGDEIAAVIAVDELTAEKALKLIEVEYEELPVYIDPEDSLKEGAVEIHEGSKNIVGKNSFQIGDVDIEEAFNKCDRIVEGEYVINTVQHCHLENQVAYAYVDERGRLVVVSSTQIPHICRRVLSQALGRPMGTIRVIKPYIGGGFGNKQDVVIEPIVAAMTLAVGGRPVILDLEREEVFVGTRVRHALKFWIKTGVSKEGRILAKEMKAISTNGGYASHGHSIAAKEGGDFFRLYPPELTTKYEGVTAYTNTPPAGAMRGYGIPQVTFAVESHLDDIAEAIGMDPAEFRKINMIKEGFIDPTKKNTAITNIGLEECLDKAKEYVDWDEKRALYNKEQKGDKRRGVGLACFSYASATWPTALEIGGARLVLNQDGSMQLAMGATEIGQGAETVFSQMASEASGVPFEKIYMEPYNDTDHSPFDTGAYASRQSYISGQAAKKAGAEIKAKILKRAAMMTNIPAEEMDVLNGNVIKAGSGEVITTVEEVSMHAYYSTEKAEVITSDVSVDVHTTAIAFGASAAEVEVDIKTGQVEILKICNVHDSGTILNPLLARGQVHGGMSMSLGLGLSEVLLFDKNGKPLNGNLLDYKLPTIMDTPDLGALFVETYDPTGPFGNKALGEPPAISPAPAIRNAIFQATGVKVNVTPMNPQRLFERFSEEGLL